jgi:signal peptidase II
LKSRIWIFVWVLIGTLILDQVVKGWAREAMAEGQYIALPWPGVFELKLTYNQGVAFGMMQGMGKFLAPIAIAIAIGAGWYSFKHPTEGALSHVAMGLLASGALGNLYDRLFNPKGVTDMFYLRIIDFPVFNIADACITVATCLLIIIWWREAMQPKQNPVVEAAVPAVSADPE